MGVGEGNIQVMDVERYVLTSVLTSSSCSLVYLVENK